MHKFLRAIGFSNLAEDQDAEFYLNRAIDEKYKTHVISVGRGRIVEQYQLPVAPSMGISVIGERDGQKGSFHRLYYFPYILSRDVTETTDSCWERHAEKETYSAVLDDFASGITLIFYLSNSLEIREIERMGQEAEIQRAYITGLSIDGMILLPAEKEFEDEESARERVREQKALYEAARNGDEEAIDTLTETDMNLMTEVSRRIETEDLYTLVESTFMPTGVECDQYSILGEITGIKVKTNVYTQEKVVDLKLNCNDAVFHVCINENDLLGVPAVGRRFKGNIWMQGVVELETSSGEDKEEKEEVADDLPDENEVNDEKAENGGDGETEESIFL